MEQWETIQGIYIHIPFCLQKCLYCDFASFARQDAGIKEEYTQRLCQEILSYKGSLPINPRATIYFGGGTPSVLSLDQLGRIAAALRQAGLWQQPAEATIEANPGTVDLEKLRGIKALGFDRISMGIQSLNDRELAAMGRIHRAQEALEALELAREAGFNRINGDLIYGYPGQTLDSVKASLVGLTKAGLTHISVYGLTVEEGTPLAKLVEQGKMVLPTEDETADMYENIAGYLENQGLHPYEISNYAVPGQESLHNIVYWHYLPYVGLGLGATGFDGSCRRTNSPVMEDYLAQRQGDREELDQSTRLSECIFMGLRLAEGINPEIIGKRFAIDFWEKYGNIIEESQKEGLLTVKKQGNIALSKRGRALGNYVFEKFL